MKKTTLYNGAIELCFDEVEHVYTVNEKIVDGVTSVLRVIDKPTLSFWRMHTAIKVIRAGLQQGSYTKGDIEKLFKTAIYEPEKIKRTSADSGKEVHEWCEHYIKSGGEEKPLPPSPRSQNAIKNFLSWVAKEKPEFLESERVLFSKKHFYSGTLDILAKVKGQKYIGDIKTGEGVYPEYLFQTAAYQQAYQEETGEKIKGRFILPLGASDEATYAYDFKEDFECFKSALVISRRMRKIKADA